MSLLGSLLKKTKKEVPVLTPAAVGKLANLANHDDVVASEKLQIGSKRKSTVDVEMADFCDFSGKMTKLVPNPAQAAYMGPNLWDEVLTFGECSTLELLNTEDFLFETGILLEKDSKKSGESTPTFLVPEPKVERPIATAVPRKPVFIASSATSPSSYIVSSASTHSTDSSVLRAMLVEETKAEPKDKARDTDILQKLLRGCSNPQKVADNCDSEADEAEPSTGTEKRRDSPPLPANAAEINMSDNELHLATVPGEDVFNPRARRFEHEELRPLPVMRKARKQFVPEEQKDDKYWERRRKNNVAAKRARDAQRIKMNQIMVRTAWLEKENDRLSVKLTESLAEQEKLKQRLSLYEKVE